MYFITPPTKMLGLDISDLSIKAVQIEKTKLKAWGDYSLPRGIVEEGMIKNFERTAEAIKKILTDSKRKFTTNYAVLSLPETKSFIKMIEIPNKKGNLGEIIKYELPKHVPVDLDEVELDWQEIKSNGRKRKFLIGIIPEEVANDYIKVSRMAGLEPVVLEIEAQSIVRSIMDCKTDSSTNFFKKLFLKDKKEIVKKEIHGPKIILDLGATRTSLIMIEYGIIQFTVSLSDISGEDITKGISEKMNLTLKEAEKIKIICGNSPKKCKGCVRNIIKECIERLAEKIKNMEKFYESHFGSSVRETEIILCGGGANLAGISNDLKKLTNRNIRLANPLVNISNNANDESIKKFMPYTTAIGLALRRII